jgi:REP element-mobilizing transposase RayT
MRTHRWLAPSDQPSAFYHCLSRVVDRQYILGDLEKDRFRALLAELAEFCQVRVLTFCIMSNHFHLLLEVPRPPDPLPSSEETLAALARLSGSQDVQAARRHLARLRESGGPEAESAWLARYHARRWNLSNFLKLLKQRFSAEYNRRMGRKGTLWEDRFRSVLVEGMGKSLVTVAAYIDLNPIRAKMVQDPKDYRWCGYGEACVNPRLAMAGIQRIVCTLLQGEKIEGEAAMAEYRRHLFLEGSEEREKIAEDGRPVRGAFSREAVLQVLEQGGRLPLKDYLRCQIRYFCDGVVFGSRGFVESMFRARQTKLGPRQKAMANPLKGLDEDWPFTSNALRSKVFG